MTADVITLRFRSPHVDEEKASWICCGICRNKTFTLVEDRVGDFPLMKCAACGTAIGRMGWAHDDEEGEK